MKKLYLIVLVLLIPFFAFSQTGMSVEKVSQITVSLDSSDATTFYYYFLGAGGGKHGFQSTAQNPKDVIYNTGNLTCYGKITKTSGTEASDSLQIYAVPIGFDGYVMDWDTLSFDFDDHTITNALLNTLTAANGHYYDFTLFSSTPTLGSTAYTFTIDMSGTYPPCKGFKFIAKLHAGDGGATSDFIASMDFFIEDVR